MKDLEMNFRRKRDQLFREIGRVRTQLFVFKTSIWRETVRLVGDMRRYVEFIVSGKDPVLFIGYAEAGLGLGESFRNMLRALDSIPLDFAVYPFHLNVESRRIGPFLEKRYDLVGRYQINIVYIAVDQLPGLYKELESQLTESSYIILRTYWELPKAPASWYNLLERIDELWVPNSFVADAFGSIFKRKITIIPVTVSVDRNIRYRRPHFNMRERRFYFLFSFDYYSGIARKNPLGVLKAFSIAFHDSVDDVGLIIKSTGPSEIDRAVFDLLAQAAERDKRIQILSSALSRDEMLSLIDQSDCYVSLHRSEGFGMGMAEALAFAKPVIATDFSGNREFLTTETGFPVPCALRPLLPGEYLEGEDQFWAEPDLETAAQFMRQVFADRKESLRRGASGKAFVESAYSPGIVGQIIKNRLREIRSAM